MNNVTLVALSQSLIFKDVDIMDLKKLFSKHHPTVQKFKKGKIIHIQDTVLDKLIIVTEGKLKAQMDSEDGRTIGMEEFCPFDSVAIPILFSEKRILPVSLFALEDSTVFILDRETLIECCMLNRAILENTLLAMSGRVSYLSQKIKFLQLHTIKQKIAFLLLKESKKTGSKTFTLNGTKEVIAKEMGVTRPSLSREFANLVNNGIISQEKSKITILKPKELKDYK